MHPDEFRDITAQVYWNWAVKRKGGPPAGYLKPTLATGAGIVSEENVELFQKHQAKIDELALGALDWLLFEADVQKLPQQQQGVKVTPIP